MFHQHQNFDPCHFFDPHQNFVDPCDPHELCQSLTHTTHEVNPHTHTTQGTHAIWQTRKINVNHKDLTTVELHLRYFP